MEDKRAVPKFKMSSLSNFTWKAALIKTITAGTLHSLPCQGLDTAGTDTQNNMQPRMLRNYLSSTHRAARVRFRIRIIF
jgi:hypothetical protein